MIGSALLASACLLAGSPAQATRGETTRVSIDSAGGQGNGSTFDPSVSGDGRYVAFGSSASNLAPGDTNTVNDAFVHDRSTGQTTRVSVDSAGRQGNDGSGIPSISADGRYVAFLSSASNLVPGDTNGGIDVFVHDRSTGQTTRVSVDSAGGQANEGSNGRLSISVDGRFVAFLSSASNLVPGDTNGDGDVFVHDRLTGQTSRVSVDSSGREGNGFSQGPSISADGRYVAFISLASNLVPGDANASIDVFVHDRSTGQTTRVSVDSAGVEANRDVFYLPSISADGRFVAFSTFASNLVPSDTNGRDDVFVHDRWTGQTTRVSVDAAGREGNLGSRGPSISADGRYVAFESFADNLVPGDTNFEEDVFVHDRSTGQTMRVSVDSAGRQGNNTSVSSSISADGRYVAFESFADNLVPGDTNLSDDVFVHDRRATDATVRASVDSAGGQAGGDSFDPSISSDGRHVAFASDASNLVPGDTNLVTDVFLKDLTSGTTARVSVDAAGGQANGPSTAPTVSADGRVVTFVSGASNLVPGDDNGQDDVYARDLVIGSSSLVSPAQGGAPADGRSGSPAISADGRYVAFESLATNLVEGDENDASDVFVYDRQTAQMERVSVPTNGKEPGGASTSPSISADGRYVAFVSEAENLVPGDANGVPDVFVHDRSTRDTILISLGVLGQADAPSSAPSISADGSVVAFSSQASNLVLGDTNRFQDVFVRDLAAGVTDRVSLGAGRLEANDDSFDPSISADGMSVAFFSSAGTLVPGDSNGDKDVFVRDRRSNSTSRVSVDSAGRQADDDSFDPSISGAGRFVAFTSDARNLVTGDRNGKQDVFVHDRGAPSCPGGEREEGPVSGEIAKLPIIQPLRTANCTALVPLGL